MLFLKKPSGEPRAVTDLKELNKVAILQGVRLPSIELLVSMVTGRNWMVKINVKTAYFSIPLSE